MFSKFGCSTFNSIYLFDLRDLANFDLEWKKQSKKNKGERVPSWQGGKKEKKKGIMLAFRTKVPAAKSRYTFVTETALNIL